MKTRRNLIKILTTKKEKSKEKKMKRKNKRKK